MWVNLINDGHCLSRALAWKYFTENYCCFRAPLPNVSYQCFVSGNDSAAGCLTASLRATWSITRFGLAPSGNMLLILLCMVGISAPGYAKHVAFTPRTWSLGPNPRTNDVPIITVSGSRDRFEMGSWQVWRTTLRAGWWKHSGQRPQSLPLGWVVARHLVGTMSWSRVGASHWTPVLLAGHQQQGRRVGVVVARSGWRWLGPASIRHAFCALQSWNPRVADHRELLIRNQ